MSCISIKSQVIIKLPLSNLSLVGSGFLRSIYRPPTPTQ
jgi:hypothetical protein